MITTRLLTQEDHEAYEAFLKPLTVTSMFLRGNALKAGLDWKDEHYHAHYFGAFNDNALCGVAALNWNGNIFIQAPDRDVLDGLYLFAQHERPDFLIKGILGPDDQCRAILGMLRPEKDNINLSETERGYILDIADMKIPSLLNADKTLSRLARAEDLDVLTEWGIAYETEALGTPAENVDKAAERNDEMRRIEKGNRYVLEVDGRMVSRTAFNTRLPDIVQIGGVYTPPDLRGKGYARAAVAGSLLMEQAKGVKRAVLFANNPAAIRAYESIGFEYVTDYHLTLLREGVRLG